MHCILCKRSILVSFQPSHNSHLSRADGVRMTGFNSIVNPQRDESWGVWNMGFEDLKPSKLAREHEQMVKQLYAADSQE